MPQRQEPATGSKRPFFTPALFQFLSELKVNNDREWFQANKARFEAEVKGPMLAFVTAFAEPLERINKH